MPIQEMSIPSANILVQGSIRSYSSGIPVVLVFRSFHTDKKENKIFLIYKEIPMGSRAQSYMTNGLLIHD
jgi:hypothetical protein